jgi:hypothetical protein
MKISNHSCSLNTKIRRPKGRTQQQPNVILGYQWWHWGCGGVLILTNPPSTRAFVWPFSCTLSVVCAAKSTWASTATQQQPKCSLFIVGRTACSQFVLKRMITSLLLARMWSTIRVIWSGNQISRGPVHLGLLGWSWHLKSVPELILDKARGLGWVDAW